ncbi:S8 family serine peptidase [Mangrovicoccus algicola]|uniref:S8 family serine peptidase n=1 Tax=Mangrovicoccus algicola TaxID=2771008 RepID=A0A8J7CIV4_9RHOB|nr:S8 family serine peptidase [Mangrovicoccus algicola]MBE3636961.1 S8 family serine peptidase [Mangrovicoccus algicola]
MLTFQDGAETGLAARGAAGRDVIVHHDGTADPAAMDALRAALGAECVAATREWGFELWRCERPVTQALLDSFAAESWYAAAAALELHQDLQLAAQGFTDDPRAGALWALDNAADTDIDLPEAWETSRGAGVLVAVIDTGIDYAHPDLAANIWINPGEIAGNRIDDDGNGFVDDLHGYDFVQNDARPMDGHSHGTHVAGTIAAVAGNGIGLAGVAPEAELMAVRILGDDGTGSVFDAIRGIEYAALAGARIANCSWGGSSFPAALADAVRLARTEGMTVIAAAGNGARNTDADPHYPASLPASNVVSVAATTAADRLAEFSNYGIATVDVAAPGAQILSTLPGAGYGYMSGTSMAAPHVAGIAALILARDPLMRPEELRQRLIDSSDPVAELAARTASGGRVNAAAAVEAGVLLTGRVADAAGDGLPGWRVFLDADGDGEADADEPATLTDATGAWGFAGLAPGLHAPTVALPQGWQQAGAPAQWRIVQEQAAWRDLGGTGRVLDLGDEGSLRLALPFTASLFGRSFDALTVSANGIVTLGSPGQTFRIRELEHAPAWSIAPLWADLTTQYGGQVLWLSEPDRVTLHYAGVRSFSGEARLDFQMVLQRDGDIVFSYGDLPRLPGQYAIGINAGSAERILQPQTPSSGDSLRFTSRPPSVIRTELEIETRAGTVTAPTVTVEPRAMSFGESGMIGPVAGDPVQVAFARDYTDPVVFLLAAEGMDPPGAAAPRLLSLEAGGFTVAMQAPGGGTVAEGRWGYLALEAGSWVMSDGTLIEAGHARIATLSSAGYADIAFSAGFAEAPAVFSQVQTLSDPAFVGTRQQPATTAGVGLALEAAEARNSGSRAAETVGWLAVGTGADAGRSAAWELAQLRSEGTSTAHSFATGFEGVPLVLAQLASARGADPAQAVVDALDPRRITLLVQEDRTADNETGHLSESLNLLALAGTGPVTGQSLAGQFVSGRLWLDADADGLRDAGEAAIAGRRVWLDLDGDGLRQAEEPGALTAADGSYRFEAPGPGTYALRQDLPEGWSATAATGRDGYSVAARVQDWAEAPPEAQTIEGLGDDGSLSLDLPFLFPFFGRGETRVVLAADGYLSFGGAGGLSEPRPLLDPGRAGPLVAGFWADLDGDSGLVRTWQDSGGARVVFEYLGMTLHGGTGRVSFQILLHEDGRIALQYQSLDGTGAADFAAGLADGAGQSAAAVPAEGRATLFTPVAAIAADPRITLAAGAEITGADLGSLPGPAAAAAPRAPAGSDHFDLALTTLEAPEAPWF